MSAGQESGSPIRENRTLLPAPLPPDEARGTLAAAAGVSTVGLRPPFDTPAAAFSSRLSRRSHLDCRARVSIVGNPDTGKTSLAHYMCVMVSDGLCDGLRLPLIANFGALKRGSNHFWRMVKDY